MILTIDQGTTGTTTLLVDEQGQVRAKAYRELPQQYPRPGWVEQNPNDIWQTVIDTANEVVREGHDIQAIGITNQRETIILWDRKTGEPVCPAIVWQDRRTAEMCASMKEAGHESLVRSTTGLFIDPYFSGTKLHWLFRNQPSLHMRAQKGTIAAGTVDSWLLWKLTGGAVHATDPTNASRTLLFNLATQDWDDQLLDLFSVPRPLLPEIRHSASEFGRTTSGPWGFDVPIHGIAGDQQAALFGQSCFAQGDTKNTYGTGCFLLAHQGTNSTIPDSPVLTTMAVTASGEPGFALEGSIFIAGAAIQWLRDRIGLIHTSEESETIARTVANTDGVHVIPAFSGLGAPHWNPAARGAIVGMTLGTTAAHIVRATLESIAYQVADLISIQELGSHLTELRVDGGACRNNLLMQFQADLLGIPINRPLNIETTAMGAAYLAGLGAGIWSSAMELDNLRTVDRIFEPTISNDERKERIAAWHKAIERVLL